MHFSGGRCSTQLQTTRTHRKRLHLHLSTAIAGRLQHCTLINLLPNVDKLQPEHFSALYLRGGASFE